MFQMLGKLPQYSAKHRFSRPSLLKPAQSSTFAFRSYVTGSRNTMAKPINLQLGWPSKSLFPTAALHEASTATLLNPTIAGNALIYGPDPGYEPLRESLATWLTTFYKPNAGAVRSNHILLSNGASGSLRAILGKFTDPTYTRLVFMIEPTYFLACPIFEDSGFESKLRGVPEDEEGVDIEFLRTQLEIAEKDGGSKEGAQRGKSEEKYPKLYRYVFYAVPTFANPSGKVMSLRRRKQLVGLARQYDALIVSDDVYDMLRWPVDPNVSASELPPPPPRLVDIDRELSSRSKFGNAVSNGSFSKIVAPGVRVSWVEGTEDFVLTLMTEGAQKSGGAPGHLVSVFMDQMVRSGSLDRHISDVLVPTYRKRYAVLMQAVEKHLYPLGIRVTTGQAYEHASGSGYANIAEAGGFFTYLTLPDDLQPAAKVAKIALDNYGLKFAHGGMMVASGDSSSFERAKTTFGRGIRLSWAWHDEAEIQEGTERLARAIRDIRAGNIRQESGSSSTAELSYQ